MNTNFEKIREMYAETYQSAPIEISDEEINLITKHECKCDDCGESIFELDDFPEIDVEKDELLCEDCYDEKYYERCIICCENCLNEEITDYFFISKSISKEVHKPHGLYKILRRPFYYGDCISGFDDFFDGAIEKVSDIEIEGALDLKHSTTGSEVRMDCICNGCLEKFTRNKDFLNATGNIECILFNKYRNELFKEYSDEQIHRSRQKIIHEKINFRGILEQFNRIKK